MDPTLGGFQSFVANFMSIPSSALNPSTSPYVVWAYEAALETVNQNLQLMPASSTSTYSNYTRAVYNLAGDLLINWAEDDPNAPVYKNDMKYFAWLRNLYGVLNFVPGVVQSTSDEGTSASYLVPDVFKNLTIANLQNLKTPYGRAYLGIAQSWGTVWGLS